MMNNFLENQEAQLDLIVSHEDSVESASSTTYAAIDLGSNSFHMVIAREVHGQLQIIDKHKEMVRLKLGLDDQGVLTKKAIQGALDCLTRFGQLLKNIPKSNIRVVGTNTLRIAKNSRDFLLAARHALGINIEIISGYEEARLIYLGVVHGLAHNDEHRLIMDIGGGSTEYIVGHKLINDQITSTDMGCISKSKKFFADGVVTSDLMKKAIYSARHILRPHSRQINRQGWESAYGSSGTIKAIGSILKQNKWTDGLVTLEGLHLIRKALIKSGSIEKLELKGLKEERKAVLPGGLAILIATFEELNIKEMIVSPYALREGLILDTLGRQVDQDSRQISVSAMQLWTQLDQQQAKFVAATALELFDQAKSIWLLEDLDDNYRKLLIWAAELHECGMTLNYKRYRYHSSYLIENSDLAGFTYHEKQLLSALVINHRGRFLQDVFTDLLEPHNTKLVFLMVILRLAVRVHRGRDYEATNIKLLIHNEKDIELCFPENWLVEHPLSAMDLEIESKRLEEAGFELAFS